MINDLDSISVVKAESKHIDKMLAMDKTVWGDFMAVNHHQLISRMDLFPQGQIIAQNGVKIYGFMNAQKIKDEHTFEKYRNHEWTWPVITDNGTIRNTHVSDGDVLFLINITVGLDSGMKRGIIGSMLVDYMLNLALEEGCVRVEVNTRLNGFSKYMHTVPGYSDGDEDHQQKIEEEHVVLYLDAVLDGYWRDPALQFHMKNGAEIKYPIKKCMPGDLDSLEWGCFMIYPVLP